MDPNLREGRRFARVLMAAGVVTLCAAGLVAGGARAEGAAATRPRREIDKTALDRLLDEARKSHSDALVIRQGGELYGEWYFGGPAARIEAMSATKSVVGLAIGRLLTEGKLRSLDQPVHELYPEWKQGAKQRVTLRHLLNHTSGLQNVPRTDVEIYPSPDFVRLALAAELSSEPGEVFSYNNKAVNLLAGIVERAAGQRMDAYIRDALFRPLGIEEFSWTLDPAGNPHVMSGLQILPADLAKLGQLVLNRGSWNGRRLIAESWFDASLRPGQDLVPVYGLLWWLMGDLRFIVDDDQIEALAAKGVGADFLAKVRAAKGSYENGPEYEAALERSFGPAWREEISSTLAPLAVSLSRKELRRITACYAEGYLGQYLVVVPEDDLVVVRMIEGSEGYDDKTDGFPGFRELALDLVR